MLSDFSCPRAVPGAPGNVTSVSRLDLQDRCGFLSSGLLGPSQRSVRFLARMDTYGNSPQKYLKKGKITHTKIKPIQRNRKGNQRRGLIAAQRSPPPNHQVFPFLSQIQGVLDEMLRTEKYGCSNSKWTCSPSFAPSETLKCPGRFHASEWF